MLDDPKGIKLVTKKDGKGKYGRILGELWRCGDFGDQSINHYMIEKGHAASYLWSIKRTDCRETYRE